MLLSSYDSRGEGHPLLGRRMPDLDLVTANGPLRVFTLLHDARPVLLNFGEPGGFDITPWADRVQLIDAEYAGTFLDVGTPPLYVGFGKTQVVPQNRRPRPEPTESAVAKCVCCCRRMTRAGASNR
jgi:hypothetical protein